MGGEEGIYDDIEDNHFVKVVGEEAIYTNIEDSDDSVENEAELSSPTAWDELFGGFEKEVGVENDIDGNPDLEDTEGFQ